jgi:hypothetical protein
MLRVEILDSADSLNLRLEGRFTGEDAEQTRMLLNRCGVGMRLVVDLTEVVFVDAVGEEVLSFFGWFGAQFVAPTSYTLDVCERLRLSLAPTGTHANSLGSSSAGDGQSRLDAAEPQRKRLSPGG